MESYMYSFQNYVAGAPRVGILYAVASRGYTQRRVLTVDKNVSSYVIGLKTKQPEPPP